MHRGGIFLHRGCLWLHSGCRYAILQYMQYMAAGWLLQDSWSHAHVEVKCHFPGHTPTSSWLQAAGSRIQDTACRIQGCIGYKDARIQGCIGYEDARMIYYPSQPGGPSKEGPADIYIYIYIYIIFCCSLGRYGGSVRYRHGPRRACICL